MKKVFIGIVALALCLGMSSCKKETVSTGDEKASTEQASKDEKAEAPSMSAKELLDKAKAEGANWSVDEWKAAFKDMLLLAKPMMVELGSIKEGVGDDPAKAMEALDKLQKIQEKYADINTVFDEFGKIAESTPNGKIVTDDEEWGKKIMEELGIPDPDAE